VKQRSIANVCVNISLIVNSERFMHVMKVVQTGIRREMTWKSKFVDQRIVTDLAEQVTLCMLDTVLNTFVFVMKHAVLVMKHAA
jgi:hypothetical protein